LVLHYLDDILCKNYNYIFMFVKVMPETLLVPFFSGHGVLQELLICVFSCCDTLDNMVLSSVLRYCFLTKLGIRWLYNVHAGVEACSVSEKNKLRGGRWLLEGAPAFIPISNLLQQPTQGNSHNSNEEQEHGCVCARCFEVNVL